MITIQRETVDQCVGDIPPLLQAHWEEVALYRDEVPLSPQFDRYRAIEKTGRLVVITARYEGALIGYSVFIINQHLHYSTCRVASNDVLFLVKDYRKGSDAGRRLIRASEVLLSSMGVQRMTWHIKPKNDWSPILVRMGYEREEIIMGKLLE